MSSTKQQNTAGFTNAKKDKLRRESISSENTKNIENHKKASEHFDLASKWHYKAAGYHENGNHDKAYEAAIIAMGHASKAIGYQTEDLEHHALDS